MEENTKNNLFRFATKELSQDAFICWCLNWHNFPDAKLYPMAADLLNLLGETGLPEAQKIGIFRQIKNIDILVVFQNQNRVIIIEDKTNSSEHNKQIEAYKQKLKNLDKGTLDRLGLDSNSEIGVRTVFFKTGFFFDIDEETVADVTVKGPDFLAILQKYQGKNEILDDFIVYLDNIIKHQKEQGQYVARDSVDWNIMRYHVAQHKFICDLLRKRFPKSLWEAGKSRYKIETGMSGAQPWIEYGIAHSRYPENNMVYQIFWRLDKRGNIPVLLLRFYDKYDKKDSVWSSCHRDAYQCFRKKAEELLNCHPEISLEWDHVKGYDTGNCFEATLLTIPLEDYLCNWSEKGELLRQQVIALTEYFIDADKILSEG